MSSAARHPHDEELDDPLPDADPLLDWMATHREELLPHVGRRVAIDPARGIVATGATLAEVFAQLDAAGLLHDDGVTITTVR